APRRGAGCPPGPAGASWRWRPWCRGAGGRACRRSRQGLPRQADGAVTPGRVVRVVGGPVAPARVLGQRDDRAVLPEALERVVDAVLGVLDVHDDVAEVQEDPAGLLLALAADRLGARLEHRLLDRVDDRRDLALARPG